MNTEIVEKKEVEKEEEIEEPLNGEMNLNLKKKRPHERQTIDFGKLDVAALKRYKRSYKLRTRHNSSKSELVMAVQKHFASMPVNEVAIIETFLDTINNQQDSLEV